MPSYRFPIVVAIVAAMIVGFLTWNPRDRVVLTQWRQLTNVKPWETALVTNLLVSNLLQRSTTTNLLKTVDEKGSAQQVARLEKAFDYQLKQYQQSVGTFKTNLFMQAAFVLFGILVLFSKDESFEIPLLKMKLQRSWLPFIVPVALFMLWLQFGFLLDSLIKTRIYGWELFLQIASFGGTDQRGEYVRSSAALFQDAGFLDGWFTLFRNPDEHLIDTNFRAYHKLFFPTVYGLLLGATHACILGVSHIGAARLRLEDNEGRTILGVALVILPSLLFSLLLISHLLFAFGGPNPNWFQAVIWAWALLVLFVLVGLSRGPQKPVTHPTPVPERHDGAS